VKIEHEIVVQEVGGVSSGCTTALDDVRAAIQGIHWPEGSGSFTIHEQSGKKRGEGSGVLPIRNAFVEQLKGRGWQIEAKFPEIPLPVRLRALGRAAHLGPLDAMKPMPDDEPPFGVEWETGNISSSHRSLNKMALGLQRGVLSAGVLVVPTQGLALYLTDRIGNLPELLPYIEMWESVPTERGLLLIIAVEHDASSPDVPRITKGTDGRALI
jgi:hypothetical protein